MAFGHAGHQEHSLAVDQLAAGLGDLPWGTAYRTNPVALDEHVPVERLVPSGVEDFRACNQSLAHRSAPLRVSAGYAGSILRRPSPGLE